MKKLWLRLNTWLKERNAVLGAWSSLLQIIIFPAILITVLVGYFQLKGYMTKPDLRLEFNNPKAMTFTVVNCSKVLAEKPSYGFGIFDLDSKPVTTVPIPWKETSYLRGNSAQGPNALMSEYAKNGHRYFGFAAVTCTSCEKDRWYWVYCIHGKDRDAWYVELDANEPKIWNPIALMNDPDQYIRTNFPEHRRIPIR